MRAMLCVGWFAMCAQIAEDEYQERAETAVCGLLQQCLGLTCPPAEDVDTSECTYDVRAADDCIEGLEGATCDQAEVLGFQFPAACERVYDCPPCDDDPSFDDMNDVSAGLFEDRSVLCSKVRTDVFDGAITAGNPAWGSWEGGDDHTELCAFYAFETELTQTDVDRIDAAYPCGTSVNALTVCDAFGNPLEPGAYVVIGHVLKGDVPLRDDTNVYQYGFVFDSDGDPENDLVANPPFTGDFFQGTDFWHVLDYTPGVFWTLSVYELANQIAQPTDGFARAIVAGNTMTALVPKSALPAEAPGYRLTVHCHQGDFGESLPTTADTEPPVEEPLATVDAQTPNLDGGVPDGGELDGGAFDGGEPDGGDEPSNGDGGCSGCRVTSPESTESTATLVLALLGIGLVRRRRKHRRC
jgi:MYXO-CTERM domain-containing protein